MLMLCSRCLFTAQFDALKISAWSVVFTLHLKMIMFLEMIFFVGLVIYLEIIIIAKTDSTPNFHLHEPRLSSCTV